MDRRDNSAHTFLMASFRSFLFLIVVSCGFLMHASAVNADDPAKSSSVANQPTKFYFFNLIPGGNYHVTKNSAALTSTTATASGAISFSNTVNTGDQFVILQDGVTLNPPSKPTGLSAQGDNGGCAALAWTANPETDVTGYTIYFGRTSVASGGATQYEDSLALGKVTSRSVCGLATDTYYFAIRARNSFGLYSAFSAEVSANITNGNPQAPVPPQQVTVTETSPGCVKVSWQASPGADIAGYVVYYGPQSVAQSQAAQYQDSVDVGNSLTKTICGFAQGRDYFAVRAYNTSGLYSGYSTEKSLDVTGPDAQAPVVSGRIPADGDQGVPTDVKVSFVLTDNQSGVDTNSVAVTINGTAPARIRFYGNPSGNLSYLVVCDPSAALPAATSIAVTVSATDLAASPNAVNDSWSFTTGSAADTAPPVFCCLSPISGAQNVDRFTKVRVGISDAGAGVDIPNIQFRINGNAVAYSVTGDSRDVVIQYENPQGFAPGSTVLVSVVAHDLSGAANSATLSNYSFEVSALVGTSAQQAAIVPDGYWADDPSRPLEIHNLPEGWTVRIFDTAGFQIRSFKNSSATSMDWAWDFANDGGRRVGRALYLVRVVDDGGHVRTAGRFLVQIDP